MIVIGKKKLESLGSGAYVWVLQFWNVLKFASCLLIVM